MKNKKVHNIILKIITYETTSGALSGAPQHNTDELEWMGPPQHSGSWSTGHTYIDQE